MLRLTIYLSTKLWYQGSICLPRSSSACPDRHLPAPIVRPGAGWDDPAAPGPRLTADVEAALYARDGERRPERYFDPVELGSFLVSVRNPGDDHRSRDHRDHQGHRRSVAHTPHNSPHFAERVVCNS